MKNSSKKVFLSLLVLFLPAVLSGCARTEERAEEEGERAVPVVLSRVSRDTIRQTLSYTGNIEPWREVGVVPDISGKLARIYVEEGDRVEKGQLLAELDTRSTKLHLEQARAGLAAARASFDDASRNWERMKELQEKETLAPQQYEKAQLAYEAARAQLDQAKAALDLAQYHLDVSYMKAPFSGVIAGKYKNEGETINPMMPGGGGVVRLMDLSKVKVVVRIPEKDIAKIRKGQKVFLRVDSSPDRAFEGRVQSVNPAADRMSRSFEVQIVVPNPEEALKPGMFARVELITAVREDVVVVPVEAIVEEAGVPYMYTVSHDRAVRRSVRLGIIEGERAEILDGLMPGEEIVTVGQKMLRDGTAVVIENSKFEIRNSK